MRLGFIKSLSTFLQGRDVGLRPDFHLIGEIPPEKNREQRREEQRYLKRIR